MSYLEALKAMCGCGIGPARWRPQRKVERIEGACENERMKNNNNIESMKVKIAKDVVVKHLPLDEEGIVIPKGEVVDLIEINQGMYKIFHHTGWWVVPSEYIKRLEDS